MRLNREYYSDPSYTPPMSEDILYLNIWTPAEEPGEKLPVAFWIHGGGFGSGWSSEMEFDGAGYCRRGVILVTIEYRLGVFGNLVHDWLDARAPGASPATTAFWTRSPLWSGSMRTSPLSAETRRTSPSSASPPGP